MSDVNDEVITHVIARNPIVAGRREGAARLLQWATPERHSPMRGSTVENRPVELAEHPAIRAYITSPDRAHVSPGVRATESPRRRCEHAEHCAVAPLELSTPVLKNVRS